MGCFDSGQSQSQTNQYTWADPLGPTSMDQYGRAKFSPTGAPQMRSQLFSYLSGLEPQMQDAATQATEALKTAAANPGFANAEANASANIAGDYLNGSPALDRAMAANRSNELSAAADQAARTRSEYAQNGMGFSTGNEQANEAAMAAAGARAAAQNAAIYGQNYAAERQNQNAGAAQLAEAAAQPLNYLSSIPSTLSAPLTQESNLLGALSSGGQALNLSSSGSSTYSPSTFADATLVGGALQNSKL